MSRKTVLVTGANGYIGSAIARAFNRAGWRTFGLIRKPEHAAGLRRQEIHPVIGSPDDFSFFDGLGDARLDAVVSNTEDWSNVFVHYENVLSMFGKIAGRDEQRGTRPLIMFTSGCKDYGHVHFKHGDEALLPHTETAPLNPPVVLSARTNLGSSLLEKSTADYDAVVLRPTIVYGYSSSVYGSLFAQAENSRGDLEFVGEPNAVMHSVHVDDCAEAYVALAEHPERRAVAGQAFNISASRYETADEIGTALAKSYGLRLRFTPATEDTSPGTFPSLTNFWQWVSSEKLRQVTGWTDRRALFADGVEEYRLAYEAWAQPSL